MFWKMFLLENDSSQKMILLRKIFFKKELSAQNVTALSFVLYNSTKNPFIMYNSTTFWYLEKYAVL